MIGFIIALEEEITSIKDIDKNIKVYQTDFFKYYLFSKNNIDFVLVFSGVGKANAAACSLEIIKTFSLTKLINIGVCGVNKKDIKTDDVLILSRNYYLDVDATEFGYKYGQVPKEKEYFENNNKLNNDIKSIFETNEIKYKECYGGTSDSFITLMNIDKLNKEVFNIVSAIDMEATAINQIASKTKIDTAFIKIVSDNILEEKNKYTENQISWPKTVTDIINLITNNIK